MSFELPANSNYRQALEKCCQYFDSNDLWFGHGTDNAWDEAVVLLFWAAGQSMEADETILDQYLDSRASEVFVSAVNRRVTERLPAAYITGEAWFCGLPFEVNPSVLVPRSPIAELIHNGYRPWLTSEPREILDLCCGSGCIGIAAALASADTRVVLADISPEAIRVAQRNIEKHGCEDRVEAICSDMFAAVAPRKFDLILSNPPYVDRQDLNQMPREYHHEPEIGLGSGEDGLDISRRLLQQAPEFLRDDGVLVLEVGNSWINLEQAYPRFPFTWVELEFGGEGVCVITREELLELNR